MMKVRTNRSITTNLRLSRDKDGNIIAPSKATLVWSNRYKAPTGYTFNDEGWVVTDKKYPKIGITILPHYLLRADLLTLYQHNLFVFKLLNPTMTLEALSIALQHRFKSVGAKEFSKDEIEQAIKMVGEMLDDIGDLIVQHLISGTDDIPHVTTLIPKEIFRYDTIWYDRHIKNGRKTVLSYIRNDYIDNARDLMEVNRKYKTKEVAMDTQLSQYLIRRYWHANNFSTIYRTFAAVLEAKLELAQEGIEDPSVIELSERSGVSVSAITHMTDKDKISFNDLDRLFNLEESTTQTK